MRWTQYPLLRKLLPSRLSDDELFARALLVVSRSASWTVAAPPEQREATGLDKLPAPYVLAHYGKGEAWARKELAVAADKLLTEGKAWGRWLVAFLAPRPWRDGWWTHPARHEVEGEIARALEKVLRPSKRKYVHRLRDRWAQTSLRLQAKGICFGVDYSRDNYETPHSALKTAWYWLVARARGGKTAIRGAIHDQVFVDDLVSLEGTPLDPASFTDFHRDVGRHRPVQAATLTGRTTLPLPAPQRLLLDPPYTAERTLPELPLFVAQFDWGRIERRIASEISPALARVPASAATSSPTRESWRPEYQCVPVNPSRDTPKQAPTYRRPLTFDAISTDED